MSRPVVCEAGACPCPAPEHFTTVSPISLHNLAYTCYKIWAMKAEDMQRLERTERMMVRLMCGVTLRDRKRSEELLSRLDIECISEVVRRGRHVERKNPTDWVSACRDLVVE